MTLVARSSNTVGVSDAKTRFSKLLEKVEGGQEITITRHGHPVAKLVPLRAKSIPEQRRAAIAKWQEISKGIKLRGLKIREMINEGRS
jgi:prevent-host-death family protein